MSHMSFNLIKNIVPRPLHQQKEKHFRSYLQKSNFPISPKSWNIKVFPVDWSDADADEIKSQINIEMVHKQNFDCALRKMETVPWMNQNLQKHNTKAPTNKLNKEI